MKMNLHKALKIKNRIVGKINTTKQIIVRENSKPKSDFKEGFAEGLFQKLENLIGKLIELKTKIAIANTGIYNKIETMSELKTQKVYVESLTRNCFSGIKNEGYGEKEKEIIYCAFYDQEVIDDSLTKLQNQIDELQDEVDEYNASNFIEFDIKL